MLENTGHAWGRQQRGEAALLIFRPRPSLCLQVEVIKIHHFHGRPSWLNPPPPVRICPLFHDPPPHRVV